jgi:hypothetical protein
LGGVMVGGLLVWLAALAHAAPASLILHHGKVITVDDRFSIHEAVAVSDGRLLEVGRDAEVLRRRGPETEVVDLRSRAVIPGLIDSRVHPVDASLTEFDHPIPTMARVRDVLDYLEARARVVPAGEGIVVRQVFIPRLLEQRYPTRAELDRAAPRHPVLFQTGPDASLNSLALQLSGIDRAFKVSDGGSGFAEKDPQTGEPTGILRHCSRYVKVQSNFMSREAVDEAARLDVMVDIQPAWLYLDAPTRVLRTRVGGHLVYGLADPP